MNQSYKTEGYKTIAGRQRFRDSNRRSMITRVKNGKHSAYAKKLYKENAVHRTTSKMRARIRHCFNKAGIKKTAKTREIMGCTPTFLNQHLEENFEVGMTWENHSMWHIDHVVPCCAFGVSIEEQKILHWYGNLRPMWAVDNLSKNGKYEEKDKVALIRKYNEVNKTTYLTDYLNTEDSETNKQPPLS